MISVAEGTSTLFIPTSKHLVKIFSKMRDIFRSMFVNYK